MVLYSEVPEVGEKSGQLLNYILQEQTIYYHYLPTVDLVAFGAYELINHTSQPKSPPPSGHSSDFYNQECSLQY